MKILDWSTVPANNQTVDAVAYWPEGQLAGTFNDSARGMMARIAAFLDVFLASAAATYGGTTNAYTVTSPATHGLSAYAQGVGLMLVPNANNTGACTVNVDTLGAVAIKRSDGADPAANDLVAGQAYWLRHTGTNFRVVGALPSQYLYTIDPDLAAIAALTATGIPERTAADTWVIRTDVVRTSVPPTFSVNLTITKAAPALQLRDTVTSKNWFFFHTVSNLYWESPLGSNAMALTEAGNLTVLNTGTAVDWVSTSDRRLKDNIAPITDHWLLVEALAQSASRFDKAGRRHIGLIAQDFQEIAPELVLEGDDGYLAMPAGSPYAAILSKAVMDLMREVAELRALHA